MQRQFTINQLLAELKSGSVKVRYESSGRKVRKTHLFADAPSSISSVLIDAENEADVVANILAGVRPAQIAFDENTPYVLVSDYDDSITKWAVGVIEHACEQLLTEENSVKPEILREFPSNIADGLTSQDVVLSYFNAVKMAAIDLAKQKLRHVRLAYTPAEHVDNVCKVLDDRTEERYLQTVIEQVFNKRNNAADAADCMNSSFISLRSSHYKHAAWAFNWRKPDGNSPRQAHAIKVRP